MPRTWLLPKNWPTAPPSQWTMRGCIRSRVSSASAASQPCPPSPIRDENGATVGVILVFHDVTEQRRAQNALRDSEQRFKAIFDQAAVGLTQATLNGRWLLVNQRFCEMLGYSRDELLNHSYMEFTHPDDLPAQLEQA